MPRVATLVMAVIGGLLLPAIVQAASAVDGNRNFRFTTLIEDQSIQEALDAIALLAGRKIEILGLIEDRKVSVNLNNATLAESIDKVLLPSNYVVVWSDEESLVVLMLDGNGDPAVVGSGSPTGSRENSDDGLVGLSKDSPEVFPPGHTGEVGLTLAEIEYFLLIAPDYDPSEISVFPVSSADDDVFTMQDLADRLANLEPQSPDTDLVPRDSEGHSVITLRDVENLRSSMLESQSSEVALWPADEDSGLAVMVPRELLIPDAQENVLPENLADLIPPD